MTTQRFAGLCAALTILGGCVSTHPLPFAVERAGTLPADEYPALEKQAAAAEPRTKAPDGVAAPHPEPYWVYAFKRGFDPRGTVLTVGPFAGTSCKPAEVAGELRQRLKQKLSDLGIFSRVTTEMEPGAYVLAGTVTRTPEVMFSIPRAGTQVEATVRRDGNVQGVIQVNALQMQPGMTPAGTAVTTFGTLLLSSIVSAAQGSRASYVSDRFADIFEQVAAGALEGIRTGATNGPYIYPAGSKPVQVIQDEQGADAGRPACTK